MKKTIEKVRRLWTNKNTYEAPVTEFIEMIKQEGICSGSPPDNLDEEEWS